jgi:hypothetical protein
MSIGIQSDNLVGSKMVLKYQQWVYYGILYTTKSDDGMGEDYSQRNWFMFPHSKSHEKTPCP